MGRLSTQEENVLQHFSHVHPLQLSSLQQQQQEDGNQRFCNGCELLCKGQVYRCLPRNYILHKSCAQIPQSIKLPAHPQHPLKLLATPTYADGSFMCDACGRQGRGFSFHCEACEFDIHPLCASIPRRIQHQAHPHELILVYTSPHTSPYGAVTYTCDICSTNIGSRLWMYRCAYCGFDAHLGCAISQAQPQQPPPPPPQAQPQPIETNPLIQGQPPLDQYTAQLISVIDDGTPGASEIIRGILDIKRREQQQQPPPPLPLSQVTSPLTQHRTNQLLQGQSLLDLHSAQLNSTDPSQIEDSLTRIRLQAERQAMDEITRINEMARVYAEAYQRQLSRSTSYPFQVQPPPVANHIQHPATVFPRPSSTGWADQLANGLNHMSLHQINGGSSVGQQGVGLGAMGEGFGLQGDQQYFGNNLGNQTGFPSLGNLMDPMNGIDWSDLISNGLNLMTGFM
ncbi:uncharacterized protein LOC122084722 [Macadamia integrifolia]|uniref:uncharacterized protein LOC122084722 n=1 Tax=Macadamia integrifolia TaxID=60698 RepID=UPI001C4F8504|nr:uncharacterized protein LOC122084722 [Macadamia integrifolia]